MTLSPEKYGKTNIRMIPTDIHTHHINHTETAVVNISLPIRHTDAKGCFSIGIHPYQTSGQWEKQMAVVQQYALLPQTVAIGECGLDKIWIRQRENRLRQPLFEMQKQIMKAHIMCSEKYRKPLIIHCVKAFNELIELKKTFRPDMCWIIHGFRNNADIARSLLAEGFYLSFGEYFQEEALLTVPDNKLFVETDKSKLHIEQIINRIAACRNNSPERLMHILQQNYAHAFPDCNNKTVCSL